VLIAFYERMCCSVVIKPESWDYLIEMDLTDRNLSCEPIFVLPWKAC